VDSWEQFELAIADHAKTVIDADYGGDFIAFSGGWHVWVEVSDHYDDEGQVTGHELDLAAAAVPPVEPGSRQHQAMEAAGWQYDPAGPGFQRQELVTDDPASWLASMMVATLRDCLAVPLEQPKVGPTAIWGSLEP
jgi:hypothetical protein